MARVLKNANWELAEKVNVFRRLRLPHVKEILKMVGAEPDDSIVHSVLQLDFRSRVLDEVERFHPSILMEATAAVLRGGTPVEETLRPDHLVVENLSPPPSPPPLPDARLTPEWFPGTWRDLLPDYGLITCEDDEAEERRG